jgi:hypothetical protein
MDLFWIIAAISSHPELSPNADSMHCTARLDANRRRRLALLDLDLLPAGRLGIHLLLLFYHYYYTYLSTYSTSRTIKLVKNKLT